MKHLFIVNPICTKIKGKVDAAVRDINAFMARHPQLNYHIHITRWSRDALGFCRRYVINAGDEIVRVHTFGGTSTLFEIVNAIVDLPNVQLASYPMGRTNIFLHYFGLDKISLFASVNNQLFADTVAMDAIRCNHNYGISNVLFGFEAYVDNKGDKIIEKTRLPSDLCYKMIALPNLMRQKLTQNYKLLLDSQILDGDYISIMVANQPWYGEGLCPAIDARPNNGVFEVYIIKDTSISRRLALMSAYLGGNYKKYPENVVHYTGRKFEISSDRLMCLSIDGETFYGNHIECELIPGVIQFVCPAGVLRRI